MKKREDQPNDISFEEIEEGAVVTQVYSINPSVYKGFLSAFEDFNPIHVDREYAAGLGFEGVVMHGGILGGFLSHFVGMIFPGRRALLLSSDLRFHQPSFLGDNIELTAKVSQKVESQRTIVMNVKFNNLTRKQMVAKGKVQLRIL